ncbi:MAG: hypothetical protein ACI4VM_00930, partial [Anaerovoracaceae bacterium]
MERTEKRIWSVVLTVLLILSSVLVPYDREPVYAATVQEVVQSVSITSDGSTIPYEAASSISHKTILTGNASGTVQVTLAESYPFVADSLTIAGPTDSSNIEFVVNETADSKIVFQYIIQYDCKEIAINVT